MCNGIVSVCAAVLLLTHTHTHVCRRGSSSSSQARQLLGVVERRGSTAYTQFVSVLCESEQYSSLGAILEAGTGSALSDEQYGK